MIDIEPDVLSAVRGALSDSGYDLCVYEQTLLSPSEFPCVCVEEIDNYTYERTIDSGSNENHARLAYEVTVYSNKTHNKRGECKAIFAVVSDTLTDMGFIRLSMNPVNKNNATIYRLVGRFTAVASKDKAIYRR